MQERVHLVHGILTVKSTGKGGTKILVRVPLVAETKASGNAAESARASPSPEDEMKRTRILLADDHSMICAGLAKLLEPCYEVVGSVEDGHALLKTCNALSQTSWFWTLECLY